MIMLTKRGRTACLAGLSALLLGGTTPPALAQVPAPERASPAERAAAQRIFMAYHRAIEAVRQCDGRVFDQNQTDRLSRVIDRQMLGNARGAPMGPGELLPLIRVAREEIRRKVETQGCKSPDVQASRDLFQNDLAGALTGALTGPQMSVAPAGAPPVRGAPLVPGVPPGQTPRLPPSSYGPQGGAAPGAAQAPAQFQPYGAVPAPPPGATFQPYPVPQQTAPAPSPLGAGGQGLAVPPPPQIGAPPGSTAPQRPVVLPPERPSAVPLGATPLPDPSGTAVPPPAQPSWLRPSATGMETPA